MKRPCVLLSGGADSRLVLLLLRERFDNVQAVTNLSIPTWYESASDVMLAHRIAELTGCTISESCSPYDGVTPQDIDPIIRRMPLCAHGSTGFIAMFKKASELNVDSVWSGQNMDGVYNLGVTERPALTPLGIGFALRRFFTSEEYISTLRDVPGKSSLKVKAISRIGLAMFKHHFRQKNLQLPVSAAELVHNFHDSGEYTVFTEKEQKIDDGNFSSPLEVKRRLFDSKLEYIRGGDPLVISTCGEINNIPVILPYSEQRMIKYFYNLRLTLRDVMKPKRYVYRYISEFAGKYGNGINVFGADKEEARRKFPEIKTLNEAFAEVISSTSYGRFMREKVKAELSGRVSLFRFASLLNTYWLNRVLSILTEEYGATINGAQEFLS